MTKKDKKISEEKIAKNPLEEKIQQLDDQLTRTMADMENLRRRMAEERIDLVKSANKKLILEILPVVDNFSRAFANFTKEHEHAEWLDGFRKIQEGLENILKQNGVEKISSLGEKFDPNLHEALMAENGEQDKILEVYEEGYRLGGEVIRHAKVKIGNGA